MNKALFLDRDGTINRYGEYIYKIKDFVFIDGAVDFIKTFNKLRYFVFVVSNQAGIGRGYYTEKDCLDLQKWVDKQLAKEHAHIDEWVFCPHHPVYGIGKYKCDCECRKPKTGMLDYLVKKYNLNRQACFMVGDRIWDYECGSNAGVKSFLLENENYRVLREKMGI